MSEASQFLINHGQLFLFAAVFLEQMGLPIPAQPCLLAAGALGATGHLDPYLAIAVVVLGCLPADAIWFYLGRYRGNQVLGLLCRISLEPDSCVRRTQNLFTRYGLRAVLVAKFVPGLSTVTPPLAGMSGIGALRFLVFDGAGSLAYGACFIGLGYFFSHQIQRFSAALVSAGGSALGLFGLLAAGYLGVKYWQRQRLLRELRMARITVAELRSKLESGENVVILDLRSSAAVEQDPVLIRGAVPFALSDLEKRHREIPRDRDIIVYCSCPNEVTAARVALLLQRKGFTRVRPLLGGIDAWREQNYALEPLGAISASISVSNALDRGGSALPSGARPPSAEDVAQPARGGGG